MKKCKEKQEGDILLAGTKKLFPTDYQKFKDAMIEAAEEDELPVALSLENVRDFTLKDLQDLFYEFHLDTSLDLTGQLYICKDCGKLHLVLEVNYPEEENTMIQ